MVKGGVATVALPKVLEATKDVLHERLSGYATIVSEIDSLKESGFYTYVDEEDNYKYLILVEACAESVHITQSAIRLPLNIDQGESTNLYEHITRVSTDGASSWTPWKTLSESDILTVDDNLTVFSDTDNIAVLINQLYTQIKSIKGGDNWSTDINHTLNDFYYCKEPGTEGYIEPTGTQWIAYKGGGFVAQKVIGAYMADYAEYFNVIGNYKIGDIICIKPEKPGTFGVCDIEGNNLTVGVVSDSYFVCTGRKENSTNVPVGLVGRVPINIVGKVNIGDLIINSHIPGVGRAMSSTDVYKPGMIVGQSLESKTNDDIGQIEILLGRC